LSNASRNKNKKAPVQFGPEVERIFDQIVAFFIAAGMDEQSLLTTVRNAANKARKCKPSTRFFSLPSTAELIGIVDRWRKDPKYVNSAGRSIDLPHRGAISMASLIKAEPNLKLPAAKYIESLLNVGAVVRTPKGTVRLARNYLHFKQSGSVPYEPNVQFLEAAVAAATRPISSRAIDKNIFWRMASVDCLPNRDVEAFMSFAWKHGNLLLSDIDDWLTQHAQPHRNTRSSRNKRVGVAMFPYVQGV
jgi:hypothetical protein